jgi:hypothetical protein
MNAYELANALLKNLTMEYDCDDYMEKAADMLRQQADRIERLEAEAKAKNNYLQQHCQKIDEQADRIAELSKNVDELEEELLKTPQLKELSDEEIRVFMAEMPHLTERKNLLMFARAILKKAAGK